jgi:ribose transport system substrate-binding protein
MTKEEERMGSTRHPSPRKLRAAVALFAVAVAVVAAGCGDDSDESTASSGGSGGSGSASGVAEARAFMEESMTPPSELGLPPTEKPIPSGKTVTYVHCGVDVCSTIAKAIKNSADILGWNTRIIASDGSPASIKAGWGQVVRMKPDVAFGSGAPSATYKAEVGQLEAAGIPVILLATTDTEGNGITFSEMQLDEVPVVGKQMASWVVSTTNGDANTLYVDLPTFPILPPVKEGFEAAYEEWCPDCPYESIDLPITSIGKDAPSRIVAHLRANPDVNVVALGYDGLGFGLPAALKAAGLDDRVQVIGEAPTETNFSYVRNGEQGATVSQAYFEIWANLVDVAARTLTDQPIDANTEWEVPWFLVTPDNIEEVGTGHEQVYPDLNEQLKTLWDKS